MFILAKLMILQLTRCAIKPELKEGSQAHGIGGKPQCLQSLIPDLPDPFTGEVAFFPNILHPHGRIHPDSIKASDHFLLFFW